ncbi:LD-carboxypeptidase [Dermabacter vaginalis]|uniref:LD-carboxypeptidase n=1 Tax=Dermabacter vaginalis TaxID=1630135 RepID=A0ABX6A548_9MICO|nr:LD-carboxypeptidase [Dermabacter vaginalis]
MKSLVRPAPVRKGDKVAVLSPAWAAPAYFPAIHEQAMRRLEELFGVEVVEYPTTRALGASPEERARDVNAAFADPHIRALFSTIGGDDQIRILRYLDPTLPFADPKPFFGYSDNTNLSAWLFARGIASFYGGSTMVHLGSGPTVDAEHLSSLRAALSGEGDLTYALPADSQDYGFDWSEERALTEASPREAAAPLEFYGPKVRVRGGTWGGCLEVLDQLAWANHLPDPCELDGAILIFETSEVLPSPDLVGRWIRGMGERGYLEAAAGVLVARPVVDDRDNPAPASVRAARRAAQRDYVLAELTRYAPDTPVCFGLPFGHTRPQYVIPYGGEITLDSELETITGHYGA